MIKINEMFFVLKFNTIHDQKVILVTTSIIEGRKIKEYKSIVFGEAINGVNYIKDWNASIVDYTGGRVEEFEKELIGTRADAISEMIKRAEKNGANAIVGVKIDCETMGTDNKMLMVVVSGTAVVIE